MKKHTMKDCKKNKCDILPLGGTGVVHNNQPAKGIYTELYYESVTQYLNIPDLFPKQ